MITIIKFGVGRPDLQIGKNNWSSSVITASSIFP